MQLTQPLTARAAGYCTARPGLRFTAAEAAAALDATEDTTTAILDMLVGRGVNGALTRDGEGYVFTDDPAKGITASCSRVAGCTGEAMCVGCTRGLVKVYALERARLLALAAFDQDADARRARAGAISRRVAWLAAHATGPGPLPCPTCGHDLRINPWGGPCQASEPASTFAPGAGTVLVRCRCGHGEAG